MRPTLSCRVREKMYLLEQVVGIGTMNNVNDTDLTLRMVLVLVS